jgi:hypothetical protein
MVDPMITYQQSNIFSRRPCIGYIGASDLYGFFSGYRAFEIQPLSENKVKFTPVEDIGGLIIPIFKLMMGEAIQRSHNNFNEALKKRAEAQAG